MMLFRALVGLLFALFLLPTEVRGQSSFSPMLLYRKVKLRLTGQEPTFEEYEQFEKSIVNCQKEGCLEKHLEKKIQEFMRAPSYQGIVVDFLNELLYLKPENTPFELSGTKKWNSDALTGLLLDIVTKDKSWDLFFTGGAFTTAGLDPSLSFEALYYSHYIQQSNPAPNPGDRIFVNVSDPTLAAGFMITPRFNLRFYSTSRNSGRKRAAAILRIGLCRTLFPATKRGVEYQEEENLIASGHAYTASSKGNDLQINLKHHDCLQCHIYGGLDRLAWTFPASELVLSDRPTPGRMTLKDDRGRLIDVPIKGIGDFARKMIRLKEYRSCQVKNLWNAFGGNPNALNRNAQLRSRLESEFDRVGRRINSFVTKILLSKEFRQIQDPGEMTDEVEFAGTHRRFLSSLNLIRFLRAKFQLPEDVQSSDDSCNRLDFSRHIILGSLLPQIGARYLTRPGEDFLQWYTSCLDSYARTGLRAALAGNKSQLQAFLGRHLSAWLVVNLSGGKTEKILDIKWQTIPVTVRAEIVTHFLHFLAGPDKVLRELGILGAALTASDLAAELVSFEERSNTFQNFSLEDAFSAYTVKILGGGETLVE